MRIENEYFHPLVAKWLSDHGYTYKHEVQMPECGRVDFVATDSVGRIWFIECKVQLQNNFRRTGFQIKDYCEQVGLNVTPSIAALKPLISDEAREYCNAHKIFLIEIEDDGEIAFKSTYDSIISELSAAFAPLALARALQMEYGAAQESARRGLLRFSVKMIYFLAAHNYPYETIYDLVWELMSAASIGVFSEKEIKHVLSRATDISSRVMFHDAIQNHVKDFAKNTHKQLMELLWVGLWERTSAQLRDELNLTPKQNLRVNFGKYAQICIQLTEKIVSDLLDRTETILLYQAIEIIWEVARAISEQAQSTSKILGIDLVTEKRLLTGSVGQ